MMRPNTIGLGDSATIPCADYFVVFRSTGEYSDRHEEPIGGTYDEELAKAAVLRAEQQWRDAVATHPLPAWPDEDSTDEAYEAFDRAREKRILSVQAMLTIDPESASDYDDEPSYFYRAVPPLAQAIKARRAMTKRQAFRRSLIGSQRE